MDNVNMTPTDSLAPSGAPSRALRIWSNGVDCFIEIPGKKGPYIERVNYDHRAIAHIFSLLGIHRVDGDYLAPVPSAYGNSNFLKGDTVDRAMADKILAQMGLIK
jgi:hypothetical protein